MKSLPVKAYLPLPPTLLPLPSPLPSPPPPTHPPHPPTLKQYHLREHREGGIRQWKKGNRKAIQNKRGKLWRSPKNVNCLAQRE